MQNLISNAERRLPANSLTSLMSELSPVGPVAIKPMLAKLSLACRTGQADDLDRKAQVALYIEQLSDLPAKYPALAIDEWIKTSVFWPAVAELRTIANRKAEAARREVEDIRKAQARRAEDERLRKLNRPTVAQMEEIKARLAEKWQTTRKSV